MRVGLHTNCTRVAESIGPGPAAFSPKVMLKGPSFSLQGGFKKTRKDGRAVIYGQNPHREGTHSTQLNTQHTHPARAPIRRGPPQ